jgi:hypothetical protein
VIPPSSHRKPSSFEGGTFGARSNSRDRRISCAPRTPHGVRGVAPSPFGAVPRSSRGRGRTSRRPCPGRVSSLDSVPRRPRRTWEGARSTPAVPRVVNSSVQGVNGSPQAEDRARASLGQGCELARALHIVLHVRRFRKESKDEVALSSVVQAAGSSSPRPRAGWMPGNRPADVRIGKTSRTSPSGLAGVKVADGSGVKALRRCRRRKPGGGKAQEGQQVVAGSKPSRDHAVLGCGEQGPEIPGRCAGAGDRRRDAPKDRRARGRRNPVRLRDVDNPLKGGTLDVAAG